MLNDRVDRDPISRAHACGDVRGAACRGGRGRRGAERFVSFTRTVVGRAGSWRSGRDARAGERGAPGEIRSEDGRDGRFEFVGLPPAITVWKRRNRDSGRSRTRRPSQDRTSSATHAEARHTPGNDHIVDPETPTNRRRLPIVREVPMPPRESACRRRRRAIVPPKKIRDVAAARIPSHCAAAGPTDRRHEARIGLDGYIGDIRIVGDAQPTWRKAAIAAVREWRFTETLLNCVPVEVDDDDHVEFHQHRRHRRAPPRRGR